MRLFIAEKPSLGRAIADVLPKPHKKGEGFIETAQGDVVTWCIGHLLEQAEPDAYDAAYKQWRMEQLPDSAEPVAAGGQTQDQEPACRDQAAHQAGRLRGQCR